MTAAKRLVLSLQEGEKRKGGEGEVKIERENRGREWKGRKSGNKDEGKG